MKRPIVAYGHPILRQPCIDIAEGYPHLTMLITDLWDTMYAVGGCGLAAPQIGTAMRLFVVDSKTTFDHMEAAGRTNYFDKGDTGIKETFINARIVHYSTTTWDDDEGCLSIPGLTQKVNRSWGITIEYFNEYFEKQRQSFDGATARMIQHEYDHTKGVLYLDHLAPLAKKMMASKLKRIADGYLSVKYPMVFYKKSGFKNKKGWLKNKRSR